MEFRKKYADIDIQKKNPTLLYYPNSLDLENNNLETIKKLRDTLKEE